ncbi:hypothetical protein PsorP6_001877 [Peronosclerospora sorghi]|uniref:Uncharacterized protein n=1 Tax=Peronosclerospora sorghi TaxID=230839 RepID=A0ACC0WWQ2_9STRA|nr:hypothetical protein PsorP6_001877 [Peronosclerospora sorghi]
MVDDYYMTCNASQHCKLGDRVWKEPIDAFGFLNDTLTQVLEQHTDLQLKKMNELLARFDFRNWTPLTVVTQPNPSMWDLINHLSVTFAQLKQLPSAVEQEVHLASSRYLA